MLGGYLSHRKYDLLLGRNSISCFLSAFSSKQSLASTAYLKLASSEPLLVVWSCFLGCWVSKPLWVYPLVHSLVGQESQVISGRRPRKPPGGAGVGDELRMGSHQGRWDHATERGEASVGLEHLQGLEIESGVIDLTPVGIMSLLVLLLDTPNLGKV